MPRHGKQFEVGIAYHVCTGCKSDFATISSRSVVLDEQRDACVHGCVLKVVELVLWDMSAKTTVQAVSAGV